MECENNGINWAVGLSLKIADESKLSFEQKRNLIFSVYSFRCLFDNAELIKLNPLLLKYGCSFAVSVADYPFASECGAEIEAAKISGEATPLSCGGVILKDNAEFKIKFDAGSELFFHFIERGVIDKKFSEPPQKYSLYESVHILTSLKNASLELKAAWYLVFPYVISIGAPHESAFYYKIRESIFTAEVFETVLESSFSLNCADSVQELWALDMPNLIVDWLLPFIDFKSEKDSDGISRDIKRFQKWLKAGRFADVYTGTEKLLDTFPDDENLLLANIAARISLDKEIAKEEREKLLTDTLYMLDGILSEPKQKRIYFMYYYSLALLGLKRIDEASEKLNDCLELNPAFEPAKVMLKLMNHYNN